LGLISIAVNVALITFLAIDGRRSWRDHKAFMAEHEKQMAQHREDMRARLLELGPPALNLDFVGKYLTPGEMEALKARA
jgi:hypothetical protein